MFLQLNFTALLATLIFILANSDNVVAAPQATKRAPNGMITMPIRSLHKTRSDVHPHIFLQQHINRSHKRYARMTGRAPPSDLELRENLQKRVNHVHLGFAAGKHSHSKRYVIRDRGISEPSMVVDPSQDSSAGGQDRPKDFFQKFDERHRHKGAAAGGANPGANGPAANDPANTNTTAAPAAPATPANGNSTDTTANGVSSLDIEASENGGLTKATGQLANNSIGLDIEADDVGYCGQVQIGTPPQNFEILMDSGSADFWVGAENCQTEAAGSNGAQSTNVRRQNAANSTSGAAAGNTCGNHQFLGSQTSSTFQDLNKQFSVTYGTGNVAGDIVQDNVVLAGLPLNNHVFGVATQESDDFSADSVPFDGLMGLAQSTLSQQQTDTPVESLAKQGTIADAITSFKISRLADQLNDGEVTFGGVDPAKFVANTLVTFPNVNTEGFWEGAMVPTVNGQSVGLDQGRTAILDTGTTLIVAPPDDATAVHQAIQGAQPDGQGGFTVPCTMNDSVALTFNNGVFAIDPRDIAFLPVDDNDPTGTCVSGISSGQIGGATEWLVGDVFLKNAYFSVDEGKNVISLAKLA